MTKFENVYFGFSPSRGGATARSGRPGGAAESAASFASSPRGAFGALPLAGSRSEERFGLAGGEVEARVVNALGRTGGALGRSMTGLSSELSTVHATWTLQPVWFRMWSVRVGRKKSSTHSRTNSSRARRLRTPSDNPSNCTPENHWSNVPGDLSRVAATASFHSVS